MRMTISLLCGCLLALPAAARDKKQPKQTPFEQYLAEAEANAEARQAASPGSLWVPGSAFADLGRDLKASQVDDLLTILVSDRASAVSSAATKATRKSAANYSVGALYGSVGSRWNNLASASGAYELDGQGSTARNTVLSTTLSARVIRVLPNGYLAIEGTKNVAVNSESQIVTIRGVVRPYDVTPGNVVRSDQVAQLEVRINGKGVVGDAVRRPFFLYRLLMGILPL